MNAIKPTIPSTDSRFRLAKVLKQTSLACLAVAALLANTRPAQAGTTVLVDPAIIQTGFMNVFAAPGTGYQFGSGWAGTDLRALYSDPALLTLLTCTNVSAPGNSYWVNADGTGGKWMDASWYQQADNLLSSNITFSGNVVSYSFPTNYTCSAFIKVFNSSFTVLQSAVIPLTNGQTYLSDTGNVFVAGNSFFSLNLTATNAGAAHVQYGFETTGPNAPLTNNPDTYFAVIRTASLDSTNALTNPGFESGLTGWTAYGNGNVTENSGNRYYNGGSAVDALPVQVFEGLTVQKTFPQFTGGANYSGVFQDVPTGPGSIWSADAKCLTSIQDQVGGANQYWIEVTFRDSSANVLATYQSPIIDTTSPTDAWIDMRVTNAVDGGLTFTAPAGTSFVRLQAVYYQPYGYAGGSVYADSMVLDDLSPADPSITSLPASHTAQVGDTVSFTVGASGQTTLHYQWQTNNVNLTDGAFVSGSTSNILTLSNVQQSQAGAYTVVVTDTAGSISASANLAVLTCAQAQNLLGNPSFEGTGFSPWSTFNGCEQLTNGATVFGQAVTAYDGNTSAHVYANGQYNGAYQDLAVTPGKVYTADAWFFLPSSDPFSDGNVVDLEVQFKSGGSVLAFYRSSLIMTTGGVNPFPTDQWFQLQATNGFAGDFVTPTANARYLVAPPGATTVRYQVTMNDQGGAGSILFDSMSFREKVPVKLSAIPSGANINLSWTSTCDTSYQIMVKTNLADDWAPTGAPVSGNGGLVTVPLPTAGVSHQFYKVQTQ
ncbi:MAG TPA: immunoglobulin domain-containing protein [Candidatus Acidoferrales bacterium]|jgi:hypothetical protein|nr:immunoglobulin domain-containing protein [Candidatus Acidoferrales bacterium]